MPSSGCAPSRAPTGGEAAALQVTDVDFLRRELHVRRQVQRVNGGEVDIRLPKYRSERTVHAAQALIGMLAEHVALGLTNEWLFEGNAKFPPHQNTVGHRWRTTLSRAGVSGVRLHDLRHFYASGLIASGCAWWPSSGRSDTPSPRPP